MHVTLVFLGKGKEPTEKKGVKEQERRERRKNLLQQRVDLSWPCRLS